jgi:hypothetical protein
MLKEIIGMIFVSNDMPPEGLKQGSGLYETFVKESDK